MDALDNLVLQEIAARGPLLLILEDLHWIHAASWALLHTVRREVEPLALLLTTRPSATSISSS